MTTKRSSKTRDSVNDGSKQRVSFSNDTKSKLNDTKSKLNDTKSSSKNARGKFNDTKLNTKLGILKTSITKVTTASTPITAAITNASPTLESLHAEIKTIAKNMILQTLDSYSQEIRMKDNLEQLKSDEFIPRPIRFKFELTTTTTNKNTADFKQKDSECKKLIADCQTKLKQIILDTRTAELQLQKKETILLLFNSIVFLLKAYFTNKRINYDDTKMYLYFVHAINNDRMKTMLSATASTAADHYLNIGIIAPATAQALENGTTITPCQEIFQQQIANLFFISMNVYDEDVSNKEMALKMKALALTHVYSKKSEATATLLDNEQSLNTQSMEALVSDKIDAKFKTFNKFSNQNLSIGNKKTTYDFNNNATDNNIKSNHASAKNNNRGVENASLKKKQINSKKKKSNSTTQSPHQRNDLQAEGSDKDSFVKRKNDAGKNYSVKKRRIGDKKKFD